MSDQKTLETVFKATDKFTPVATKIADAGKNASQDVKRLQDTIKKGVTADAFEKSASTIETAFEQAENRSVSSIEGIESAIERGFNKSIGTIAEMSQKCDVLQRDFDASQAKIKLLEAEIEKLGKSTDDTKDKFEGFGDSATGVSDTIKGLAGAAATFFGVSAVSEAVDNEMKAVNQFQARVGATAVEMAEYKESIKALYKDAMGESMEDVSNSMATVKVNTGLIGEELKNTTNTALLLRDTFDFDVNESTRAASMMMKQFGLTGDEAYNLIAQGAQNGLDKNGDLLDTINEYSVHFKQLGFDAVDMLNMLVNGTENGTFSVDKLGDSIKEFGIRVIDSSDTTKEGFKAIGLNADNMAKKFKVGGETGKAAFAETITALKNMEDPIKQNTAGVNLFGTMWEDLGAEGVFALSNLNGKISETSSALKDIEAIKYQDIGSSLTSFGRSLMSDFTDGFTADSDTVVSKIENLGTTLSPTVKELGKTAGDAIELVSDAFEFACEHAEAVKVTVGSVIGMVTAKKAISGIASFAEGFSKLLAGGPTLPLTLAAGAISAVVVGIHEYSEWAKEKSLEEHFGNVTLSLFEMEKMADMVVTSGNLGKIRTSLEEFKKLDSIKDSIDDTVSNLDKLNWKVGIGFTLTEDENESYKASIDGYISGVEDYVEQQHYSATVAINLLFGEDDKTGSSIIENLDKFYNNKQTELQVAGKKLKDAVNDAYKDGLLTFDEAEKIDEIRAQIAKIEASIASDKLNSGLEGAKTDFSYKDITSDSAKEYAETINNTVNEVVDAYVEARDVAVANATTATEKKQINNKYLEQKASAIARGSSTVNSTIYETYADELQEGNDYWKNLQLKDTFNFNIDTISNNDATAGLEGLKMTMTYEAEKLWQAFDKGLSHGDKKAISELYEKMQPQHEELLKMSQSYMEAGETIPEGIRAGILDNTKVNAMLGDQTSLYTLIAYNATRQNPDYANAVLKAKQSGEDIPDEMLLGIELAKPGAISAAETAAKDMTDGAKSKIEEGTPTVKNAAMSSGKATGEGYKEGLTSVFPEIFSKAIQFTNTIESALGVSASVTKEDGTVSSFAIEVKKSEVPIGFNAFGGIYDRPTLTWVAEAGDSEAIIPLNDTQRAYDLWQEAGQAIGAARGYTGTAFTGTAFDDTPKDYNMTSTNISATEKTVVLKLEGGGEIKIPKTLNQQDIINILTENIKPILIDIINQEMFEEGDGVYET